MVDEETGEITEIPVDEIPDPDTETLPALNWFGATISVVGMQFPAETTQADWEMQGAKIALYEKGRLWAIGDWLNFGNARWGEKYVQATVLFHLDVQTLTNVKYVASRFPIERRFTNLSWSHHAVVAKMSPEDQMSWLTRAATNHWTREELRQAVKGNLSDDADMILPPEGESDDEGDEQSEVSPIWASWDILNKATLIDNIQTIKSLILQAMNILESAAPKREE